MKLVAFDFDGTITMKDTFILFIRFTRGSFFLYWSLLVNSVYLFAYKLGLYPNWKAKQRLFCTCFKGVSSDQFDDWCRAFTKEVDKVVRPWVMKMIDDYVREGTDVLIVSASVEEWIKPWASKAGISIVLATEVETDSSARLTGNLKGRNCYGQEKVNRIVAAYPCREAYTLIAYGDSRGDKELIAFADQGWLLNTHTEFIRIH